MPLMDEFKEERDLIKTRSFKEKMQYFWDYYKWHVIFITVALILVVSLIYSYATRKETAFYCAFINMGEELASDTYTEEFAKLAGIDPKKETIYFDAGLRMDLDTMDQATFTATQKIMVYISSKELDVMLANKPIMDNYAYNEAFVDLREFLTPEEYEKYEPYFYYMDRAVLEEEPNEYNSDVNYPEDPTNPEAMTDPVPVGIYLHDCKKLSEAFSFGEGQCLAFISTSQHAELNHLFLSFVMEN